MRTPYFTSYTYFYPIYKFNRYIVFSITFHVSSSEQLIMFHLYVILKLNHFLSFRMVVRYETIIININENG